MHFYESSIITTKDGLHCQVYGNEHPVDGILVKPKYIPTDHLCSEGLQCRFISGKKMNRLNLWAPEKDLKEYLKEFKKAYPKYIYKSPMHSSARLFFKVPIDDIERIYFPRRGVAELCKMPENSLDPHLKNCFELIQFLKTSGLREKDFGITYSTLMGHYFSHKSDINIVVYGKKNFWKLMDFLKNSHDKKLRWKTEEEWLDFHKKRNRYKIFSKQQFLKDMMRKRSEGFYNGTLFVIFAVEEEGETWFKWGKEKYIDEGHAVVKAIVEDDFSSVVRPGCYGVKGSAMIDGQEVQVSRIVFYSRDYCMLARPGEHIEAAGRLERVEGDQPYYRLVVGYFDSYFEGRRQDEYIRTIQ